ncbi:hypothetical protein N7541_009054 [Penicillium brevicompactum]|uniref:Uncharacterized protein n=1 Tax=Penicillium brevicompactum TaxID=5074 RepID=A0A9W9R1J5_PENBR|nr:hypothetical protein N7541_009054 [Penicillium brevicompactum]
MAASPDTNIERLNGNWILNKELSSNSFDAALKLQKISWLLRKAISFATIYLQVLQYPIKDGQSSEPSIKIDFIQTATGGLSGTKEERLLDWKEYDHTDYFFGAVRASSQFVSGAPVKDGSIRPEFDLKTNTTSAEIKQFLTGEINEDWTKSAGFLVESKDDETGDKILGCWVHTFERSEKLEWTAEQIWGFEMIGELRYFTRRVVIMTSKGQHLCQRLVYDFAGY